MRNSPTASKSLPYSLHRLAFILQRMSDDILQRDLGVGYAQFKMMMGLKFSPGCEQRYLARHMDQTEAGISRQIRLMQDMKLVDINLDSKDRRRRHLTLTVKGEDTLKKAKQLLEREHNKLLTGLSGSEIEVMKKVLDKMLTAARISCTKPKA